MIGAPVRRTARRDVAVALVVGALLASLAPDAAVARSLATDHRAAPPAAQPLHPRLDHEPALAVETPHLEELDGVGGTSSEAVAVNGAREVAGWRTTTTAFEAFLWRNGTRVTLPSSVGSVSGINDVGQVVGRGYVWSEKDGLTPLMLQRDCAGTQRPLQELEMADLNDEGAVVGSGSVFVEGVCVHLREAWLWSNGQVTWLGKLPGGNMSSAAAINDDGQVVGSGDTVPGGIVHGFLWAGGQMTDLGTLGGDTSTASAINDAGVVVGSSSTAGGETHAFRWAGGTMTDLGTLEGGGRSEAVGINSLGQVVGTCETANGESHACLWDDGEILDLGTLGGAWSEARAISDDGMIVGVSADAGGQRRAAYALTRQGQSLDQLPRIFWQYGALMAANQDPADTDGDGIPNAVELVLGLSVTSTDTDLDKLSDKYELDNGLNPTLADSNGDDLVDSIEVDLDGDKVPNAADDPDGDGKVNQWDPDNDGDGIIDGDDLSPAAARPAPGQSVALEAAASLAVAGNGAGQPAAAQSDAFTDAARFDVTGTGKPTYLDFQVRPEDATHLQLPTMAWDWVDSDKQGQMQGVSGSKDDITVSPMLEVTTTARPDPTAAAGYGMVIPQVQEEEPGLQVQGIDIGDADGDGKRDLVLFGSDDRMTSSTVSVAAGGGHTCAVADNGRIDCWGANGAWQLGIDGDLPDDYSSGHLVRAGVTDVTEVATGAAFTCAVVKTATANQLWCWGRNTEGQMGDGSTGAMKAPTQVTLPAPYLPLHVATSPASATVCAIGKAPAGATATFCWGINAAGQVTGVGTPPAVTTPTPVPAPPGGTQPLDLVAVAPGDSHTCGIDKAGAVWCWGRNDAGQVRWPPLDGILGPTRVSLGQGVQATAIASGGQHSCAITAGHLVFCWGSNASGQAGGTPVDLEGGVPVNRVPVSLGSGVTATAISAGAQHSCILTGTKRLLCWGANGSGQIGLPTSASVVAPTLVDVGEPGTLASISAGGAHTCAADTSGRAWCWGRNQYGQVRQGAETTTPSAAWLANTRTLRGYMIGSGLQPGKQIDPLGSASSWTPMEVDGWASRLETEYGRQPRLGGGSIVTLANSPDTRPDLLMSYGDAGKNALDFSMCANPDAKGDAAFPLDDQTSHAENGKTVAGPPTQDGCLYSFAPVVDGTTGGAAAGGVDGGDIDGDHDATDIVTVRVDPATGEVSYAIQWDYAYWKWIVATGVTQAYSMDYFPDPSKWPAWYVPVHRITVRNPSHAGPVAVGMKVRNTTTNELSYIASIEHQAPSTWFYNLCPFAYWTGTSCNWNHPQHTLTGFQQYEGYEITAEFGQIGWGNERPTTQSEYGLVYGEFDGWHDRWDEFVPRLPVIPAAGAQSTAMPSWGTLIAPGQPGSFPGPTTWSCSTTAGCRSDVRSATLTGPASGLGVGVTNVGATLANIGGTSVIDLFISGIDPATGRLRYLVGWDLAASGQPTSWSAVAESPPLGTAAAGGGATVTDVNGDGTLDIVFVGVDSAERHAFHYMVGRGIHQATGGTNVVATWGGIERQLGQGEANRVYVPLSPVMSTGVTVALQGRMYLPDPPAGYRLDTRLVWMVTGKTACDPTKETCERDGAQRPYKPIALARYKEDFSLTGFTATEMSPPEAAIIWSDNTIGQPQALGAAEIMEADFMKGNETAIGELAALFGPTATSGGLPAVHVTSVATLGRPIVHFDAARHAVPRELAPNVLEGLPVGRNVPIFAAYEDHEASLDLASLPAGADGGLAVDLAAEPVVTTRSMNQMTFATGAEDIDGDGLRDGRLLPAADAVAAISGWLQAQPELIEDASRLVLAWTVGSVNVTRIGDQAFETRDPGRVASAMSDAFQWLGVGMDGVGLLVDAEEGIREIKAAWNKWAIARQSAALNQVRLASQVAKASTPSTAASVVSKISKVGKGVEAIGIVVTVASIGLDFYKTGAAAGWDQGGIDDALIGAWVGVWVAAGLLAIAAIPVVGWIIAGLLGIGLAIAEGLGYGQEWVVKWLQSFIGSKTALDQAADADMRSIAVVVDDVDDNGIDVGDRIGLQGLTNTSRWSIGPGRETGVGALTSQDENPKFVSGGNAGGGETVLSLVQGLPAGALSDADLVDLGTLVTPDSWLLKATPVGWPDYGLPCAKESPSGDCGVFEQRAVSAWFRAPQADPGFLWSVSSRVDMSLTVGCDPCSGDYDWSKQTASSDAGEPQLFAFDIMPGSIDDFVDGWAGLSPMPQATSGSRSQARLAVSDPTVPSPITPLDQDGDLLPDVDELAAGTDPTVADSDGDGLPDGYERMATVGKDGDTGVPLDPTNADSDGDGIADGAEVAQLTSPGLADTDGDGLGDRDELAGWTVTFEMGGETFTTQVVADPTNGDADGDGVTDASERDLGENPASGDSDGDGAADARLVVSVEPEAQSVQYSDAVAIAITARDLDSGAIDITAAGLPAGLALGPVSCTPWKSGSECTATISGVAAGPAGPSPVTVTATDGTTTVDATVPLEVTREDATISYDGDTLGQVGAALTLRATVTDSAGAGYAGTAPETGASATVGALTRAFVRFDVYPATSCGTGTPVWTGIVLVIDSGLAGDGVGTATTSWVWATEATFCVVAAIVDTDGTANAYYAAPPAQAAALSVYLDVGTFATGGGWLAVPADGDGHGVFAFDARYGAKGQPNGHALYVWRAEYKGVPAEFRIKSGAIRALGFTGATYPLRATFQGTAVLQVVAAVDGTQLYASNDGTFLVTATDGGAGRGPDSFGLTFTEAKASAPFLSLTAVRVGGGEVVVHLK